MPGEDGKTNGDLGRQGNNLRKEKANLGAFHAKNVEKYYRPATFPFVQATTNDQQNHKKPLRCASPQHCTTKAEDSETHLRHQPPVAAQALTRVIRNRRGAASLPPRTRPIADTCAPRPEASAAYALGC